MEAPALPRTLDELAEWSVYADHLMTIGDPLGDRIAAELALPADASLEDTAAFRATVARHCPVGGRTMLASWTLGFARIIELRPKGRPLADTVSELQLVEEGTLARARDVLRSTAGSRVEELVLPAPHYDHRHYRRLFAALPASCRRVTLTLEQPAAEGVAMLLECLPPTVTELSLATRRWNVVAPRFLDDRFAIVELGYVTTPTLDDLIPALDATTRVRVRIDRVHGPLHPRFELGGPGDAAIVALDSRPGRYVLGRPPKLTPLDAGFAWILPRDHRIGARGGIVPVRRLLAGEGEIKELTLETESEYPRVTLLARGDRWTVKCGDPLTLDGQPIAPQTVTPIRDGARFEVGGRRGRFFCRDVDAQVRAVLHGAARS